MIILTMCWADDKLLLLSIQEGFVEINNWNSLKFVSGYPFTQT